MTNEEFVKAKACFCTKCVSWYFVAGSCNCYYAPVTVTTTTSPDINVTGTSYGRYCSRCGRFWYGYTHECNSATTFIWKGNGEK